MMFVSVFRHPVSHNNAWLVSRHLNGAQDMQCLHMITKAQQLLRLIEVGDSISMADKVVCVPKALDTSSCE